jgi:hypothetical protein
MGIAIFWNHTMSGHPILADAGFDISRLSEVFIASGVFFLLWGVFVQLQAWTRLKGECSLLEEILGEGTLQTAETLLPWIKGKRGGEHSLVARHVEMTREAVRCARPPSASELVDATEEEEASHKNHTLPNLLLAVALIIGLAGTMLFLMQVVGGDAYHKIVDAGNNLSGTSNDQLRSYAQTVSGSIGKIFGGLGQAFKASLTGIGVTVFITLIHYTLLRPAHSRFVALLHRVTLERLIPLYSPPDTRFLDRLDEVTATMTAKLTDATEILNASSQWLDQQNVAVAGRLEEMVSSVNASTVSLSEQVNRSLTYTQKLSKAIESLDQLFNEGGVFPRIALALENQAEKMDGFSGSIGESFNKLQNSLTSPLSETRADIASLLFEFRGFKQTSTYDTRDAYAKASEIATILGTVAESLTGLREGVDQLKAEIPWINRTILGIESSFGPLAGIPDKMDQERALLESLQRDVSASGERWNSVSLALERVNEKSPAVEELRISLSEITEAIRQTRDLLERGLMGREVSWNHNENSNVPDNGSSAVSQLPV